VHPEVGVDLRGEPAHELVSWPLLGQLIMQAPKGDPQSWSTWAPFLACLAFTAVALPAYVLMSRRDARDTATL
jgi:hypothetical protein